MDPEASTVPAWLHGLAEAHGARTAVELDGVELSYADLERQSAALARGLLHRGVGKGARIAIIFANGPEWAVAWAAVTRIGAVAVPLSTLLAPPELARVLRHSDAQGVITQRRYLRQDFVENLAGALGALASSPGPELRLPEAPFLRWIVGPDGALPAWARPRSWLDGGNHVGDDLLRAAEAEVHGDEPAILIYTSGQSAEPKGVLHAQGAVLGKVRYLREMFGFSPGSRIPGELPFFWVGGLVMALLTGMDAGATVVCTAKPMAKPPLLGAVGAGRPDFKARGGTTARLVGLGMSETFGPYSWGTEPPHPDRPQCPPLVEFEPDYEVKVVDGEITLRGPTLMLGLHKVDRAETFDADGFYPTGDAGEVDGGAVFFVGRLDDTIKVSGANVAPAEVERELVSLDGVAAAHVVGVDGGERGPLVAAAVVAADGATLDPPAIVAELRSRLSSYKVPTLLAIVEAAEIPVLAQGKVAKRELADLLRRRLLDG